MDLTDEDLRRLRYRNGHEEVEIVVRDGRLLARARPSENPLVKHSDSRYSEYAVTPGSNGRVEYLTAGSRSFARVP